MGGTTNQLFQLQELPAPAPAPPAPKAPAPKAVPPGAVPAAPPAAPPVSAEPKKNRWYRGPREVEILRIGKIMGNYILVAIGRGPINLSTAGNYW